MSAEGLNKEDMVLKIKTKLGQVKNWLLIVDNAKDDESIQPYLPMGRGHIIITSRNKICWKQQIVEVPVFGDQDVIDYVIQVFGESHAHHTAEIKVLGKQLGYLPLAISQAMSVSVLP